jgi:2-dehydropantoate 2-reductase
MPIGRRCDASLRSRNRAARAPVSALVRFAIVGAGAIGAYVGASLARGGHDVALVARGAHLAAMRERGVSVLSPRGDFSAHPLATDDLPSIGEVDAVLLTLKAHQLTEVAERLAPLYGPSTVVVAMQNGVPWWYFQRHGGPYDGLALTSVDPGGTIGRSIPAERVLGCVIYCSAEIEAPGVIRHSEGTRFSLGEPDRTVSERALRVAKVLEDSGLRAPVEAEIRRDIWIKLLGNAAFNPISALTRATLVEMCDDPGVNALVRETMQECVAIAGRLGVTFDITIDRRIDGARRVGAHKTSMLQDLEAGKPLEIEALAGAVVELGEITGVQTPATREVYALVKLLEQTTRAGSAARA